MSLTDTEVAKIEVDHHPIERTPDVETCWKCRDPWPCAVYFLLADLRALREGRVSQHDES